MPPSPRRCREEEAEREAKQQHQRVGDGDLRVGDDQHAGTAGKQHETAAAANAVREVGAGEVSEEGPEDQHEEIAAGVQHRQLALGLEVGRQPGSDRVVRALMPVASRLARRVVLNSFGEKISRKLPSSPSCFILARLA